MRDLFDIRATRPGVRLQRLELYNWGTFDSSAGEVYASHPRGRTTLLVGRNGAGKSTLVDALLTLLVPGPIRNYNVAAGAKKTERTERSYVLGACDQRLDDDHSVVTKHYLRKGTAFYSIVLAHFRDENADGDPGFTLAQLMYPKADGGIEHVHLMADGDRSIEADLAGLSKSDGLLASLKARGFFATRTFSDYHRRFVKRTGVRPLAMDMFNQTVAVKDIQSLNRFIRDHMLEPNDGRQRVVKLIEHFSELRTAHRQLVDVKRQRDCLLPVEKHGQKFRALSDELVRARAMLDAGEPFFRETCIELAEPELTRLNAALTDADGRGETLRNRIDETRETERKIRNEIDSAGGQRLRELPGLIRTEESRLEHRRDTRTRFLHSLGRTTCTGPVESEEDFDARREALELRRAELTALIETLQRDRDERVVEKGTLSQTRRAEDEELETLRRRRTSLPGHLDRLRGGMCQDLGLAADELVFASELIAVRDDAKDWESSIEAVLRNFALSLLVPDRLYRSVSNYIEDTRLTDAGRGQRLVYLRVGGVQPSPARSPTRQHHLQVAADAGDADRAGRRLPGRQRPDETAPRDALHADSMARKLHYRGGHPLVPWVRGRIESRFDYRCCQTVEQFRQSPRLAITRNRHIKTGDTRHEKDDRSHATDASRFVLGWDNREKRRHLEARIAELDEQIATLGSTIGRIDAARERAAAELDAIDRCREITRFEQIDTATHQAIIDALRAEERSLRENNERVKVLQTSLEHCLRQIQALEAERDEVQQRIGTLRKEIVGGERLVQTQRSRLDAMRADGRYERSRPMWDTIAESIGDPPMTFDDVFDREEAFKQRHGAEARRLGDAIEPVRQELTSAMTSFIRRCPDERDDLDANVEALPSYLAKLKSIRDEDLPRHEERFKQRLNDTVTKEIGVFHSQLQNEGRHIERKVDELNGALRALPYNDGTHMRLDARPVRNAEIADFRASLRACLDDTFEDSDAAREARFGRIESLIGRLSEQSTWRDRVIDVRRWYDFGACEVEDDTGRRRGYYEDSSGQSGGEKARLAFTILVAAIAYQYDLDLTGQGDADGGFRFVVVDEMFSKIDDRFAEYALRLFERFGLQLIIVAPLDAKARVTEPFVQHYLQILKDDASHRSRLVSMTAREYEEVVLDKLS